MLDLKEIESFYPEILRPFKRSLLREYLQIQILGAIFNSFFGHQLCFMGGTAIRILHGSKRFSEDLDFDNRGLSKAGFAKLTQEVGKKLIRLGYQVEVKNVFHKAYRSYIRFKKLLYDLKLSGHEEEKVLIQIDAEPQRFSYEPEKALLNKFDVLLKINAVPASLLLAQKISCIFDRPRAMGHDFYDTVFLMGKTQPDYSYLAKKLKIKTPQELKTALIKRCQKLNFPMLAKDVAPFLFDSNDKNKVLLFPEYLASQSFLNS